MPGTLSVGTRLGSFCQAEGCPIDFIAALQDRISASRLRIAVRGEKDLEGQDSIAIDALLSELKEIAAEHAPFKLRWSDPKTFRQILEARRRERAGEAPQLYSIVFDAYPKRYFVRLAEVEGRWRVITDSREINAAGVSRGDAEEIIRRLKDLGHVSACAVVNSLYSEDMASELAEVWPTAVVK